MKISKMYFTILLVMFALLIVACGGEDATPQSVISDRLATETFGASLGGLIWPLLLILVVLVATRPVMKSFTRDIATQPSPEIMRAIRPTKTLLVLAIVAFFTYANGYIAIDQTKIGVVTSQGEVVRLAEPGANIFIPYWENVTVFPVLEWTYATMSDPVNNGDEEFKDWPLSIVSKDGVQGDLKYTVQGSLNPNDAEHVYEKYGTLENAIRQLVKTPLRFDIREAVQNFEADKLYSALNTVEPNIVPILRQRMKDGGLELVAFGFRKPTLGIRGADGVGDYERQLNEERVAEQNADVEEQKVAVAEAVADQAVAQAAGLKEAEILAAEGRAQALLTEQKANADADLYSAEQNALAILALAEADAEAANVVGLSLSRYPTYIDFLRTQLWGANGSPVPATLVTDGNQSILITP